MSDIIKSSPLAGWERTNDAAREVGVQVRSLIGMLNAIGADVLYLGNHRHNKINDRERAIRNRIQRRNPPRRARRQSRQQNQATA
jgi:hypothetical protein